MKVKFLAILLLIGVSQAQERLVAGDQVPDAPSTRRFWSAENKIDLSIFAGQLAADAITTRDRLFAPCHAPLPCRARHATPYSCGRGCFGRAQYRAAEWTALVSHAVLRGAILRRRRESAV